MDRLAESGARNVAAVPLMLLAAGHAKDDIPATLVREKLAHPELTFSYGRALGVRPELLELMDERISAVVGEEEKPETAVLIEAAAHPTPMLTRSLQDIPPVLPGPHLPPSRECLRQHDPARRRDGLDRCRSLGAKRIVVFSYFLFTGVLEERIRAQSRAFAQAKPGAEVRYAGYFGPDPGLADLVLER